MQDELVTLYSTLVNEDNFQLENDVVSPATDFLKQVEDKVMERGEIPAERKRLSQLKNKILEKVKDKKLERTKSREMRDSGERRDMIDIRERV